jgi:flagellar basal body-associated protein FliL
MDWIVVSLIVITTSVVVCVGGVYYRLFFQSQGLSKQEAKQEHTYEPPDVNFETIYRQK